MLRVFQLPVLILDRTKLSSHQMLPTVGKKLLKKIGNV